MARQNLNETVSGTSRTDFVHCTDFQSRKSILLPPPPPPQQQPPPPQPPTIAKVLTTYLEAITGKHSIDPLQKTGVLGSSHIIRKVLQCEA